MPDLGDPNKEAPRKPDFMREKIVKQPMSRKRMAKRALAFLLIAVLFGVIAAISFVLTRPVVTRLFDLEPTTESVSISFTKDEPETTPYTEAVSTSEEVVQTEPIEEILQSAAGKYQFDINDVNTLYQTLNEVSQRVDKGIVMVHSAKQEMDWFGNPVINTGQYSGIIIAKTDIEVLILTVAGAVEDTEGIRVTFGDGSMAVGTLRQTDQVLGMAVVSVAAKDIPVQTKDNAAVLTLGNSYSVQQGDFILAIGAPGGMVHSSAYGNISYVARGVQAVDSVTRVFYSDIICNTQMGTFLVSLEGNVIGWATDEFKNENSQHMTTIYSISDYKGILEKLTNGVSAPYLGVKGQEVTTVMAEGGTPPGVYVVSCQTNSPAYDAGIQNGDIITMIGTKGISTVKDLQTQVENLTTGDTVKVTVQRKGREEYKELEYQVHIRAR